jgi:hypothetical protein
LKYKIIYIVLDDSRKNKIYLSQCIGYSIGKYGSLKHLQEHLSNLKNTNALIRKKEFKILKYTIDVSFKIFWILMIIFVDSTSWIGKAYFYSEIYI